ncbi:hypothetical protein HDU97_010013 [Phlyctochytrium planicorne]|nr:hypothetical protein HDU97_010013 [Phlyctochytrium planicorne]
MPSLKDRLMITGLVHAVFSILLVISSAISRIITPTHSNALQPPWELPLLGLADFVGVFIILEAVLESGLVLELAGYNFNIFQTFIAVYLTFTVPIIPIASIKLFHGYLSRRALAKTLLADGTVDIQRAEKGAVVIPGKNSRKQQSDLSFSESVILFTKCIALSFLSTLIWGICRLPIIDTAFGSHGYIMQRWLSWVTVTTSLMRTLMYAIFVTLGQFESLAPGLHIPVYICLGLSLLAVSIEAVHRLRTCHESDASVLAYGSPIHGHTLDKGDAEFVHSVIAARRYQNNVTRTETATKGGQSGKGQKGEVAVERSAGFSWMGRKPQFRNLRDRLEHDVAKRADPAVHEVRFSAEVAKVMAFLSSVKIQSLASIRMLPIRFPADISSTSYSPLSAMDSDKHSSTHSPRFPRLPQHGHGTFTPSSPASTVTGPPPFPMEIPDGVDIPTPTDTHKKHSIHGNSPTHPILPPVIDHAASTSASCSPASPACSATPSGGNPRQMFIGREKEIGLVMVAAKGIVSAFRSGNGSMGRGVIVRGENGIGKSAFVDACRADLATEINPITAIHTVPHRTCLRSFSTIGALVGSIFDSLNVMKSLSPTLCPTHLVYNQPSRLARSPTLGINMGPKGHHSRTNSFANATAVSAAQANLASQNYLSGFPEAIKPLLPLLNVLFPNFPNSTSSAPSSTPGHGASPSTTNLIQSFANVAKSAVTGASNSAPSDDSTMGAGSIPETDASRMRIDQPGLFMALATVILEVVKYFSPDVGKGTPILFVVEDVQWCDEMSLQVLSKLLRVATISKIPFLLICTARDVPAALPFGFGPQNLPPISQSAEQLQHNRHTVLLSDPDIFTITLQGLRPSEVKIMADHLPIFSLIPEEVLASILEGSRGSPLYVRRWAEVVKYYACPFKGCPIFNTYEIPQGNSSGKGDPSMLASGQPLTMEQMMAMVDRDQVEENVRKALALSVEASDRYFLQQPVEAQELMSIVSVLGHCMDVEAMFYLYKTNVGDAKLEIFIKVLRCLTAKSIFILTNRPDAENEKPTSASTKSEVPPPPSLKPDRAATVSDVPRYDPIWIRWDHDSTLEVAYKKLSMHTRTAVHISAARFLLARLMKRIGEEGVTADVGTLLEIAHHLDRGGNKEVAMLYFVVAAEQDSYGYNFLLRNDILSYADSISYRSRPAGPVDPPRPAPNPAQSHDLLHSTLEYLLSVTSSNSDATQHARNLWVFGSQTVGRVLPTLNSSIGSNLKMEAEWKIQAAAMKAKIRHERGRRGMDDNAEARRAGIALRDLVPLIGLNLDASYYRALHHIIHAVGLLESHGASNGELLVGYAWLQHHLAVGRHFGLRERIIKKGRDLIAAMSPEMMSKRRRSVSFFEGMIGMGSAAAGGYVQADAFLGSAIVLADLMVFSNPLTDLYAWHVITLFQMGRIREASRLARDARNKLQSSGGSADQTSRDLSEALHILLCLNVGHGSHSRGLTQEVRRLAEELIHRVLDELTVNAWKQVKNTGGVVKKGAILGTGSLTNIPGGSSSGGVPVRTPIVNDHTFYISTANDGSGVTPITASKTILISILALIAIHLPNPTACGKLLDHLLFPIPIVQVEEEQFTDRLGIPEVKPVVAGVAVKPGGGVSGGSFSAANQHHHHPLKAAWVPGIPFAIACALEASVRALVSVTTTDRRRSSFSPQVYVPSHWKASDAAINPAWRSKGNSMNIGVKAWRARTDAALDAASNAVKQKWAEPLSAEVNLFRACVRAWEVGGVAGAPGSPPGSPTGRSAGGGGGGPVGGADGEVRRCLVRARDAARLFQRTWVEAFVHAQADVLLNGGEVEGVKPPTIGFEDHKVFERECGGKVCVVPIYFGVVPGGFRGNGGGGSGTGSSTQKRPRVSPS